MNNKLIVGALSISILTGCSFFKGTPEGLVFHCTFDSEKSVTTPAAGVAGKLNHAKFHEGKVDNALFVTRGLSACEFPIPTGMKASPHS